MAALVAAIVFMSFIILFYYTVDPSSAFMPHCVFKTITGYDCPGCGFQRALHAALHGDLAVAWNYNAFVFFAVPAAVCFIAAETVFREHTRLRCKLFHPAVLIGVFVAIVAWWIGRNVF